MEGLTYYCDDGRHLVCVPFSVENLHIMAQDLGIKRCWFHRAGKYPHYDIPKKRIAEIQAKCNVVPGRVILSIIKGEHDERVPRDRGETGTDDVPPER